MERTSSVCVFAEVGCQSRNRAKNFGSFILVFRLLVPKLNNTNINVCAITKT